MIVGVQKSMALTQYISGRTIAEIRQLAARTQYIASLPVPKDDLAGGQGFRDPNQSLIR